MGIPGELQLLLLQTMTSKSKWAEWRNRYEASRPGSTVAVVAGSLKIVGLIPDPAVTLVIAF